MRFFFFTMLLLFAACRSVPETERLHKELSGNWLILYPDHQLENKRQRVLYAEMQDSIVGLSGLKLVTFESGGGFREIDSVTGNGRWGLTPDKIFFISGGGKGFSDFSGELTSYDDGLLKVTQHLEVPGETIRLVWHFKKLKGDAADLFKPNNNAWRKHAASLETEQQIRTRLSQMLNYYSDYYSLVTNESSFFVPTRVQLPLKFYRHAIGLKDFESGSYFSGLFYDSTQAHAAHRYLSRTIKLLRDDFPTRDNYVKEYVAFMKMMAKNLSAE